MEANQMNAMALTLGVVIGTLVCMTIYQVGPMFGPKQEQQPAAVVVDQEGNILQDLRPFIGSEASAPVFGPLAVVGGFVGLLLVIFLFTKIREQVQKATLRSNILGQTLS